MDWQGWFLPRGLSRRRQSAISLKPPAEEDLERLRELREAGSRIDLPHPVRSFLLFEDERSARAAMAMLDREGSPSQLRAAPEGRWTLTVVDTVVPTPGAITKLRETLTAVAESQGGRHLGWQAPLVY